MQENTVSKRTKTSIVYTQKKKMISDQLMQIKLSNSQEQTERYNEKKGGREGWLESK